MESINPKDNPYQRVNAIMVKNPQKAKPPKPSNPRPEENLPYVPGPIINPPRNRPGGFSPPKICKPYIAQDGTLHCPYCKRRIEGHHRCDHEYK
ncbi:MAG: hypothetical protein MJ252_25365 [archaeon]|nr:hypothetical protein [archaeon]